MRPFLQPLPQGLALDSHPLLPTAYCTSLLPTLQLSGGGRHPWHARSVSTVNKELHSPTLQAWLKSSLGALVGHEEPTCIVHGDYRYDP